MRKIRVVRGRGSKVREAALQRVRAGAVLEGPEDFLGLIRQASLEVQRAQAWKKRRAA